VHAEKAPIRNVLINYKDILGTASELNFDMLNYTELEIYLR